MAQTAPQFDWESARPVDEEPQQPAATPSATDSSYPGAPLNDKQEATPLSPALFDWESARPAESAQDFDIESAVPLKELAEDPAYLMSREQFRAYRNESKETDSAVSEFLGGIPGVIPGIASMASGAIGELGQQVAQNWYRPDKLLASLTANQNEGVRRMSLSYVKMVDYIGQNLRDMDINRQREAAYGEQLRQKMQQEGKLTGDPIKDHDMVMQALFAAKDAGEIPLTDQQMAEDEERAYQDYWRGKNFDQAIGNITDIKIAGMKATTPSMEWGARNMVTGEYVAPGKSSPDVVSMAIDPANILAAGVGSLARVNALRRAGILLGKGLGPTGEVLAKAGAAVGRGADAVTERIQLATGGQRVGEKVIGGLSPEMQAYGGVTSAAAVGYMTGGDTPLDQAMTGALALLPAVRMVGGTLRKAGTAANAGWIITREMDAGAMSAARAEATKGLAANAAIPERYAKFIRGEGRASADSTLRRVAQDQANPRLLRSLSQFGDNVGLTSAVRATDDAIGGALVGASATAPFALAAPEPEQAGGIVGMGLMFGAVGGVAGGKMTRMAEMQDAMVARMLVDAQASGGNADAFSRLPHQDLVSMAGLQAFSRGKLTFKPLTTSEYRVNLDVTKRRGENSAGFYVDTADDGTSTVFINMGEPSAVAGVVAKIRPATKGGKTIEIRDKDGNSTFTYVPNESRIAVKQGDSVGVGTPLTRGTPSRLSVPEEIAHAIFSSKAMDGLPRDEMRNYINQRYKTEGVAARGREYAARIVDQEIAAGVYGAADSIDDAARDRLVEQRFTEFSQASIEDGADPLDWARDEIIAASLRASAQGIDLARLRNQSNFSRLAEQVVSSSAQALRVLGVDVDKMGRVLDPAGTFRDNPVFADPAMRRMVTKYMRDYDQWLAGMEDAGRKDKRGVRVAPSGKVEDYANSQHTVLREIKDANGNGTGVFENDVVTRGADGVVRPKKQSDIDRAEVSRAAQIKSLWDAGKTVPTASTEFGKRRVNGRDIVGGPTLPKQWDLFTQFPQWIREFARQLEAGRGDGRTWIADYNAIGTGSSGRYRVTNLGNIEAILREVAFVGWQVTKKNHLLATVFDMNAFRAAAKRAIDNGELGEMGNNMDEVNATLLQYLDNHKNGRPGEYGIGQTKKNILNGLIGTGTSKQTAANPFYAELNPRGSVRTFRVDRLNDLRDTGRTGYNFMYEPINANMMPDVPVRQLEDTATERFQWMRNKEGGQKFGNQQITVPLTEELFQRDIRPGLRAGYATSLAEYQAKHPEVTHASYFKYEGKGDWKFNGMGSSNELRPNPPNRGWAMPVDSFKSPAAKGQGKTADSEAFPTGRTRGQAMPEVERPIKAAVVTIGDRIFTGTTHAQAFERAVYEGAVRSEGGKIIAPPGAAINADLFMTNDGKIIDRFEASRLYDSSSAERAIERGMMQQRPAGSQPMRGQAMADVGSAADDPPRRLIDMPQSALKVLHADSAELPKPSKKLTNATVALTLADVAERHNGGIITSSNITPEQKSDLMILGADEAEAALKASGKNAGNWYSTAIEAALGIAGVIYRELSDIVAARSHAVLAKESDPVRAGQFALRLPLAITSQNMTVKLNTRASNEQFNIFLKTGKFDPSIAYGEKAKSISGNLDLANVMIDELGSVLALEDFVSRQFTVRELEAEASKIAGRSIKIAGRKDDIVNGAAIFGPKIGQGFLQNLMGKFDPVTIDLWMRRTWGRWTGDVVGDGVTAQRLARLIDQSRKAGRKLPDSIKRLRTTMRSMGETKTGKAKKPELTMSEDVEARLEAGTAFRKEVEAFAKEVNAEFQGMYKMMSDVMSPSLAKKVQDAIERAERLPDQADAILSDVYNAVIREQSRVKQQLDKKWAALPLEKKKEIAAKQLPEWANVEPKDRAQFIKKAKPILKGDWLEMQHQAEGRTAKLDNPQKNIIKPAWANAAKSIVSELNPIDIPSDMDRRVITEVVNGIREELERRGYTVTNADVQAILWYPEKDLWAKLRGEEESILKQSYDDEFINIAEGLGLGREAREVAKQIRGY